MKKKHLICTKPFEWFEVYTTNGKQEYPTFLCCNGWLPKSTGDILKHSPKELWHSNEAKEIRASVTDGSFKFCNKEFCPHLNEISGPVKYVDDVEYKEYKRKVTAEDFLPERLNCSYDMSCNLTCPSCRTSLIMAKGESRENATHIGNTLFDELGDTLDLVYITGSGDPFASKHYLELLTGGVLAKYPNLKLHLHTNAQLFTPEIWKRIAPHKSSIYGLEVSIDGASQSTYEKNRRPGKWEVLLENLNFIAELKRSGVINYLRLSFVVQQNNYLEMPEFIKLGEQYLADSVYFSTLGNWGTYSKDAYLSKAVHKEDHPEHESLLDLLLQIDSDNPKVDLGYFLALKTELLATKKESTLNRWWKKLIQSE